MRKQWRLHALSLDFRVAFRSWWRNIFVLTAGVSIFSAVARELLISLRGLVASIVAAFREVTHPIVDFIFSLANVSLTDWQKDIAVVWLALGGAVLRTMISALRRPYREDEFARFSLRSALGYVGHRRWLRWLCYVSSPLFWPFFAVFLFATPYLWIRDGEHVADIARASKQSLVEKGLYVCDFRIQFLIQLGAIVFVIFLLTLMNFAGLGQTQPV
jgi:hypothetical protein